MTKKILIAFLFLAVMSSAALAASVRVIIQEGVIRKDRRFFSPSVMRVPYGSFLEKKGQHGEWLLVNYRGKDGWIHKNAVQEQKFETTPLANGRAQESSQEEIATAGKGFTPEVEKAFREKNPNMQFDQVNRVQNFNLDEQRIQSFIRAGGLKEPGGGP